MIGEAMIAETAIAEPRVVAIAIIPEVLEEGKQLVIAVEITLVKPAN